MRRARAGLWIAAVVPLLGTCPVYQYCFPDVAGPDGTTVVPPAVPASWETEHHGEDSRLAVLLTDPDSNWLGIVHGLKSIGVPFTVTRDAKEAVRHRVVLLYPIVSGKTLTPEAIALLDALPRHGGTLIGVNVLGGLRDCFGLGDAEPSRQRLEMHLDPKAPLMAMFHDPRETTLPLGKKDSDATLGTYGYTGLREPALAQFSDGTAALTQANYGKGHAYAFGLDIGQLILLGQNNRDDALERSYVNHYEPLLDVFLRLLKAMYVAGEPSAVTLGTVPDGKSLAVVLTHDIDFTRSVENSSTYSDFEKAQGIRATYFLQTKYIRDFSDDIFFNAREVPVLKKLIDQGMEIGSHSVSHSRMFAHFPLGSGNERYPDYRPFVKTAAITTDGSILGELRVSKFLIEKFIGGPETISFRPGHLSDPYELPQALKATGYRYSSSVTANNSLTHLPFQLNYGREYTAETGIYEFPLTIEDEELPEMDKRLPQALELARKLSVYGGTFVILIHPNITGPKFEFEKGFVLAMKDKAWFGALSNLGRWWAARDQVGVDVKRKKSKATVSLHVPQPMDSLPLFIPAGWTLNGSVPYVESTTVGDQLVLKQVQKDTTLSFKVSN